MKTVNVLITSCGRRVELVKAFKEAQRKSGSNGIVIAADMSKTAPALYFADKKEIIPRISDEKFISSIIEICKNNQISVIVPTIDTELQKLADNKEKIYKESGAIVMISSPDVIKICNDKRLTAKFLKEKGFNVPKTYSENEIINGEYKLPAFIKPLDGSSSINAFKVNSRKEMDFFMSYIKNPIVQEFAEGTEYTVDAFLDFEGNVLSIVPRIRLATRSGEILKGKIDKNRKIINEIRDLLIKLKPLGHITIQGKWGEDGIFRYIEINPRYGGGAPMSIKAGADTPTMLLKLLQGEKLEYTENFTDGLLFARFDDTIEIYD